MRQRTMWRLKARYTNAIIKVGRVYNPNPKRYPPDDIIRMSLRAKGGSGFHYVARLDEAMALAAGVALTVMEELYDQESKRQKRAYRERSK